MYRYVLSRVYLFIYFLSTGLKIKTVQVMLLVHNCLQKMVMEKKLIQKTVFHQIHQDLPHVPKEKKARIIGVIVTEIEKNLDHALDHHRLFLLKRVVDQNQRNTRENLLQDLDQGIIFY